MEIDKIKELFKNFEPQVIFNQDLKKKNLIKKYINGEEIT